MGTLGVAIDAAEGAGAVSANVFAEGTAAGAALPRIFSGDGAGLFMCQQSEAQESLRVDAGVFDDPVTRKVERLAAGGGRDLPACEVRGKACGEGGHLGRLKFADTRMNGGATACGAGVGVQVGETEDQPRGIGVEPVTERGHAAQQLPDGGGVRKDKRIEAPYHAVFAVQPGQLTESRDARFEGRHAGFEPFACVVVYRQLEKGCESGLLDVREMGQERRDVLAPEDDDARLGERDPDGFSVEGVSPDTSALIQCVEKPVQAAGGDVCGAAR